MNYHQHVANAIERETGLSFAHLMSAHPILGITTKAQRSEIFEIMTEGNRNQANAMDTTLTIVNLLKGWNIPQTVNEVQA